MPFPLLLPRLTLTAATLLAACATSHAALLAGWDFQGTTDPEGPIGTVIIQPTGLPDTTPQVFTANAGVFQSSSQLYLDGSNGSSEFIVRGTGNGTTELGALAGIIGNSAGTTFGGVVSPGSLALWNRSTLAVDPLPGIDGKSAVFKLSMVGYESLQFSFAVQRPSSPNPADPTDPDLIGNYGVSLFTFAYSTDGILYEPWGVIDTGYNTSVINGAFAMPSALTSVNNEEEVFVRMTVSGSTVDGPLGSSNSTRIDNIQFNATAIPEPGGLLLAAGAAASLVFRRGRR